MKLKLSKRKDGQWYSFLGYRGMIASRIGGFWHCFFVFLNFKNYKRLYNKL